MALTGPFLDLHSERLTDLSQIVAAVTIMVLTTCNMLRMSL